MSKMGSKGGEGATSKQPAAGVEQSKTYPSAPLKINHKNVLNLLFFILNVIFTYGLGNGGWFNKPTNSELSEKYQTIITPNGRAFAIWAIIFTFQALFTVVQMFPRFRALPMVQKGVSYWYVAVCATQVGWTFTFAFENIRGSVVFMLLIWVSLMGLVYSQYQVEAGCCWHEWWLLQFPFAVHAGWITAASALNISVLSVFLGNPAHVQLAVAIVSLAVLHAISVWVLFHLRKPNYVIALVLVWAFGWIYFELKTPEQLVEQTFSPDSIQGVQIAALAVSMVILIQVIVRIGWDLKERYSTMRKSSGTNLSSRDSQASLENQIV